PNDPKGRRHVAHVKCAVNGPGKEKERRRTLDELFVDRLVSRLALKIVLGDPRFKGDLVSLRRAQGDLAHLHAAPSSGHALAQAPCFVDLAQLRRARRPARRDFGLRSPLKNVDRRHHDRRKTRQNPKDFPLAPLQCSHLLPWSLASCVLPPPPKLSLRFC